MMMMMLTHLVRWLFPRYRTKPDKDISQ